MRPRLAVLPLFLLAIAGCGVEAPAGDRRAAFRSAGLVQNEPSDSAVGLFVFDLSALDSGLARVVDSVASRIAQVTTIEGGEPTESFIDVVSGNLVGYGGGLPERRTEIPAAAVLRAAGTERVCTHTHGAGDSLLAEVADERLPRGTHAVLRVVESGSSTRAGSTAFLTLAAEWVALGGQRFRVAATIEAADVELQVGGTHARGLRRALAAVTAGVVSGGRWDACLPRGGAVRLALVEPLTVVTR